MLSKKKTDFKPASVFVPKDQCPPSETSRRCVSRLPTPSCSALRSAIGVLYHLDDFELVNIGAGFFSDVFLVTPKTPATTAAKAMVLKMNKRRSDNMIREVQLLKQLKHPNILKFEGACVHQGQLHALTEYMDGGSLDALLASFELSWSTRMSLSRDIACGLSYLHSKSFFHRDLTSKNVFVKGRDWPVPIAVIGDFGLATRIPRHNEDRLPQVGSPYWMSPECLQGQYYDQASDIFSFGIIMCEVISRLDADPDHLPRTANFGVDYIAFSALCPKCPPNFLKVAFNCVRIHPRGRPSASSLVSQLSRLLQSQRFLETHRHAVTNHALGNSGSTCHGMRKRALSDEALKASEACSPSEKARRHQLVKTSTTMCVGREMSLRDPDYAPIVDGSMGNPFEMLPYFRQQQEMRGQGGDSLFTSCFEDVDEARECKVNREHKESVWPEKLRAAHSLPQKQDDGDDHDDGLGHFDNQEYNQERRGWKEKGSMREHVCDVEKSGCKNVDIDLFEGRVQLLRRLYSGLTSEQGSSSSTTTTPSWTVTTALVTRDDAALISGPYNAPQLRRRGSCESGFFSSSCWDNSALSSTVSVGSSLMTLSDLEEDLRAASAFLCHDDDEYYNSNTNSSLRSEEQEKKALHAYEKDIRAIVAYFETTCRLSESSALNHPVRGGRRATVVGNCRESKSLVMPRLARSHKIETLIKRVVEKESRERLRRPQLAATHGVHQHHTSSSFGRQLTVCDGIVKSKLLLFDDKTEGCHEESLVNKRKKVGFVAAKTALFDQKAHRDERISK